MHDIQSKDTYQEIYNRYNLPLHFDPLWLEAVCVKGDWGVNVLLNSNEELEAVQVYHIRKHRGFTFIIMPIMTSYSGIYIHYPDDLKTHSRISYDHRVTKELFKRLPKHDFYYQQFLPSFANWMPLYWEGYSQTTRYTYQIDTRTGEERMWSNLKSNVRTNIRKAETLFKFDNCTYDQFWEALDLSCQTRNKKNPYRREVLSRIYHALQPQGRCDLRVVRNIDSNNIEAGIMLVNDRNSCFYICGFFMESTKNMHPFSMLMWDSIKTSKQEIFDFEGSMIKDIEGFFRTFGGQLVPHFKIWRTNNPLLRAIFKFKKPDFLD